MVTWTTTRASRDSSTRSESDASSCPSAPSWTASCRGARVRQHPRPRSCRVGAALELAPRLQACMLPLVEGESSKAATSPRWLSSSTLYGRWLPGPCCAAIKRRRRPGRSPERARAAGPARAPPPRRAAPRPGRSACRELAPRALWTSTGSRSLEAAAWLGGGLRCAPLPYSTAHDGRLTLTTESGDYRIETALGRSLPGRAAHAAK